MRQEEVTVFIILISIDLKFLQDASSLDLKIILLRVLLGCDSSQSQMAKLQFCIDPEETLASLYQV